MTMLPIAKSFFAPTALAAQIAEAYGFHDVQCQLLTASMRDVYRVRAAEGAFVLYVYRAGMRTPAEIAAEWEIVAFAQQHGLPVAPALPTRANELALALPAPEGMRYGVLAPFVAGELLRRRASEGAVVAYGQLIARFHRVADTLSSRPDRPTVDTLAQMTEAATALVVALPERPDVAAFVRRCAAQTASRLPQAVPSPHGYGLIHGDVIRGNALVDDAGVVTLLDFDLCGEGWRAYDVASYCFATRGAANEAALIAAFLRGYEAVRPLEGWERAALPAFEAARAVFTLGVPALEVNAWGRAYLDAHLDESLAQLRAAVACLEAAASEKASDDV